MAGDSSWDSVVLALPFDGLNNGTDIRDRSNSRKTITAVGSAKISTTQSQFGGASLILDGTGDYLTVPDSGDWAFGAGSFTIEVWVKRASTSGTMFISSQVDSLGGGNYNGHQFSLTATNLTFTGYSANTGVTRQLAHTADTNWHHVAVCSNGTNLFLSIDGVVTSYAAVSVGDSSQTLAIGIDWDRTSSAFNGHFDDLRITKGVARYTTNFTPPTAPNPIGLETVTDTDYSNVVLLLNADGATVVDESATPKTITVSAPAALSKVDSKVGAGALVFDGTGGYLSVADHAQLDLSSTYTIEAWVKLSALPSTGIVYPIVARWDFAANKRSYFLRIYNNAGVTKLEAYASADGTSNVNTSTTWAPSANVWYHLAMVSDGTNLKTYVNGTLLGSTTAVTPFATDVPLQIGGDSFLSSYSNTYIDAVRITAGVARYTSTFTPPNYVLYSPSSGVSVTPVQGQLTLTGQSPAVTQTVQLTPTQRQITLTGQTPGLPTPYTATPTQRQLTLTGQTPGLPVPYTATPTQRQLTVTGQIPTLDVAVADTGNVTGRGFVALASIVASAEKGAAVTGQSFVSAAQIIGGAVVESSGFTALATITASATETAYVTGRGFTTSASIELDALFNITVSGRGFTSVPELIGGAVISGRNFTSGLTCSVIAPTSFRITGQTFAVQPAITAQAINNATITGRGFVAGIVYSRITGRGFSVSPVIKSAFTAEYAEAMVLNLVPVTASERKKTTTYAVTRYQNYPFQHIARIGNTYYGVKSDGLYELTGEYDANEEVLVNGTIQLNEDDLGAFNSQNIPYVYLNGDDDYSVTAFVDDVQQPTFTSGFGGRRAKLARGSKGRYWYFKIEGIKGLQGVEYRPDSLSRKVK